MMVFVSQGGRKKNEREIAVGSGDSDRLSESNGQTSKVNIILIGNVNNSYPDKSCPKSGGSITECH